MNAGLPQKLQAVTVQHIGAETLVYDEARHQAFCLNPTSATVWNLADGTRTPAQIAAAATLALAAPVSEPLVLFTLAELRRDGLLAPKSLAAVPPPVLPPRRHPEPRHRLGPPAAGGRRYLRAQGCAGLRRLLRLLEHRSLAAQAGPHRCH